jgi:uncharacterized protein
MSKSLNTCIEMLKNDIEKFNSYISSFTKHERWTILEHFVKNEDYETLKLLLKSDIDVNLRHKNKSTALMLASEKHKIVKLLIDSGANLDLQCYDGWTALTIAAEFNNYNSAKLLIDAGASVDMQSDFKSTALMLAAQFRNDKIVKLLIDAGANLDLKHEDGLTALMFACKIGTYKRKSNIVKMLIDAGANVNLQDNNGCTAFMMAFENNEIINILLDADHNLDLYTGKYYNAIIKHKLDKLNKVEKELASLKEMIEAIYYSPEGPYKKYLENNEFFKKY